MSREGLVLACSVAAIHTGKRFLAGVHSLMRTKRTLPRGRVVTHAARVVRLRCMKLLMAGQCHRVVALVATLPAWVPLDQRIMLTCVLSKGLTVACHEIALPAAERQGARCEVRLQVRRERDWVVRGEPA